MHFIGKHRQDGLDTYRVAVDESESEGYEIRVYRTDGPERGRGSYQVWHWASLEGHPIRLNSIPIFLTPFILEATRGEQVPCVGSFGEEPGDRSASYKRLVGQVEAAFAQSRSSGLGTYRHSRTVNNWVNPRRSDWTRSQYLYVVNNDMYRLTNGECRFRLIRGKTYGQESITRAVVEVVTRLREPEP
jgi:hypothetical protein